MPNLSERQRNNVKAGVFVTLAIMLGLGVVIVLTDALSSLRRRTRDYTVVFSVQSGVPNLKKGSEVRVGGLSMGRVTHVEALPAAADQALTDIAVRFNLDQTAQLYKNAAIYVSSAIIGSDGWLDIPSVGTPDQGVAVDDLRGRTSSGFLTSLVGGENKDRIDNIIQNAEKGSEFLGDVRSEYDTRIVPIIDDVKATTGDIREVANDLKENRWPNWATRVDEIMKWASDATAKIDGTLDEGRGLFADARELVAENREPIKTTIANARDVSERVKTETIDKIHKLLETGQEGLDSAVATLKNIQVDYGGWATDLGDTLANATLASQQLKLATIEVRRSPWKLLYRPQPDEVEHELLYDATRAFALAASDLKASSASMQRVLEANTAETLTNADAFKRLQQSLLDSLQRYEAAQQRMLDVLIANPASP